LNGPKGRMWPDLTTEWKTARLPPREDRPVSARLKLFGSVVGIPSGQPAG